MNEEQEISISDRHSAVINAIHEAIEIFSSNSEETFNEVMTKGIQPIVEAIGLDRVVIYAVVKKDGENRFGQIYRWDKSEGGLIVLADELKVLPNIPVLERWMTILSKGKHIRLRKSDYSNDEAAFLDIYGIKSILLLPIFTYGELWGSVSFQDHTNDQYFDEDCANALHSAARIFTNAIIRTEMRRSLQKSFDELKRREKMTSALNRAAIKFLSQSDESFEDTMTAGFGEIADVFGLDRFSLLRNISNPDGSRSGEQIYRWDKKSGGTTAPVKELKSFSPDKFVPDWGKILTSGGVINGPVRDLPEAQVLQSFGLVSIVVTPVFINNNFWGIGFFEDLHAERYFEDDSVEMMRSAAFLCANTVIEAEMMKSIRLQGEQLKVRLKQQELISDLSRGFISSGDSQKLVTEAIAKLGRYHDVSLVFIFTLDGQKKEAHRMYHWAADGTQSRDLIDNAYELGTGLLEILPEGAAIPIVACDDTATNPNATFQALYSVGVRAVITVPLYVEGRLWGMMAVEQTKAPRRWTDNEKSFVAMTASTIAGIIMRDIYNTKLKNALDKAT